MKTIVGLVLLLIGASTFFILFFRTTRTEAVIDISFILQPGEKYEPYSNGTFYHTKVFTKSILNGEVAVEGGSLNFTVNGYNTQHLKNVSINQNYSFAIYPADDLYTFAFANSESNIQSSVRFTLEEVWMDTFSLILAFIILLTSAPVGIVLTIRGLRKKQVQTNLA